MNPTESLTPEQLACVKHRRGVACVIAGAGTGKTKTLCERLAWLVEGRGCEPERVLVTTFSRKATAELLQRAKQRLGKAASGLKISTIDALVAELAQEAAHRGWLPNFQLIGEAEQRVLLWECAQEVWLEAVPELPLYLFRYAVGIPPLLDAAYRAEMTTSRAERRNVEGQLRDDIKRASDAFWDATSQLLSDPAYGGTGDLRRRLRFCVERYQRRTAELGFLDYYGLQCTFADLLRKSSPARREFASRYDAVLVDEFQDTSRTQFEILRAIAGRKLWIVGDPCQQIYAWRGAILDPIGLADKVNAKRYFLTDNFRSTQPILDSAYTFLSTQLPSLGGKGVLRRLHARKPVEMPKPVFRGTLDQALRFISTLLAEDRSLSAGDVAILSRNLTSTVAKRLREKALKYSLRIQLHSSTAENAMEATVGVNGRPPRWKPGEALERLYRHPKFGQTLGRTLRGGDFDGLRRLRPLATAADAVDRAAQSNFDEAWPALRKTQDRDVAVTTAVAKDTAAVQVMTIHAAKGLEFPVVLVMTWGKGFPKAGHAEDARLAYVGMTRAKDMLILVNTQTCRRELRRIVGVDLPLPPRASRWSPTTRPPPAVALAEIPPLVAASHLDIYCQCPLKFAAYHEGRFLPQWSSSQSMGSRMHKALELFLCAWPWTRKEAAFSRCLEDGIRFGDSPLRDFPKPLVRKLHDGLKIITDDLARTCRRIVGVERRYQYSATRGVVEGVIDALIEDRDGALVLKEWKTNSEIPEGKMQQYTLQTSAALLAMKTATLPNFVDLVPVFQPRRTERLDAKKIQEEAPQKLDQVFSTIADRKYTPRRGSHCKTCSLKRHCPAW